MPKPGIIHAQVGTQVKPLTFYKPAGLYIPDIKIKSKAKKNLMSI